MKITHNKVGQNLNLNDLGKADRASKTDQAKNGKGVGLLDQNNKSDSTSTKVELSQRAQDIKRAKEIAMSAPDIREDKVAALQKMIDEGKYKVDSKDIADKMVDEEAQWA